MIQNTNKRAFQRKPIMIPMVVKSGEDTYYGIIRDYSLQGGKFEGGNIAMPKDWHFSFRICLEFNQDIEGSARVVSNYSGKGSLAFMFDAMSEANFGLLERLDEKSWFPSLNSKHSRHG
jgi:hypothetical protein